MKLLRAEVLENEERRDTRVSQGQLKIQGFQKQEQWSNSFKKGLDEGGLILQYSLVPSRKLILKT